jgi:hypothetical protein
MNAPAERRSNAQFWILVGLFFAPLLLAFLLYYSGADWRPSGRTNRGELIQPPRPLPGIELPTPDGAPLPADFWRGKWTLVYVGDGRCDQRCREALTLMRQTRLALNAEMTRVQRALLATGHCCDRTYLDAEHPGLALARVDGAAGAQLLATFPDAQSATRGGRIYVVDPLGNLMMSHAPAAPGAASKGLLEDLRKLLKLSHIG